jgi:hypothetical protein
MIVETLLTLFVVLTDHPGLTALCVLAIGGVWMCFHIPKLKMQAVKEKVDEQQAVDHYSLVTTTLRARTLFLLGGGALVVMVDFFTKNTTLVIISIAVFVIIAIAHVLFENEQKKIKIKKVLDMRRKKHV